LAIFIVRSVLFFTSASVKPYWKNIKEALAYSLVVVPKIFAALFASLANFSS
jgi:hypothetical protein